MTDPAGSVVDEVAAGRSAKRLKKPLTPLRRTIASSGVAIVVLLIGLLTYDSIMRARVSGEWVEHTHLTIDRTRATLSDLKDAETGQRGFILTGDESYLQPYARALSTLAGDTSALRTLTSDNPVEQQRLDGLAPLISERLAELDRAMALRRTAGIPAAVARLQTDRGKHEMDSIRAVLGSMETTERGLLRERAGTEEHYARIVTVVLAGGTLVAVLIAIVLNSLLTRYAESQASAALELDLQNTQLEAQALELQLQNQQLQEQASELELQQLHLQEQASEMEAQNEQLQQQATELETQTEELQAATEELEEQTQRSERAREVAEEARIVAESANRAKADFLATMSHELRTPLNAIGGYVDLMELGIRGAMTVEQLDDLARIKRSGRHLLALINDILNFAKLEAGKVDFRLADVSVLDMVGGVEALVAPQMHAKGIRVSYERCEPDVAARADAEKVQQILLNLLTNAQKFTQSGGEIGIACTTRGVTVVIEVRDNGCGIPADKLGSIFEPFVQVDRHLVADNIPYSQRGIGLGLAISRELARAMAGDIVADSTVGVGSTFTLTLPRGISLTDGTALGVSQQRAREEYGLSRDGGAAAVMRDADNAPSAEAETGAETGAETD